MSTSVISQVCQIPVLSDARLTEIGRSEDGKIEFIELQASHVIREFPEQHDVEEGRPSKKVMISQHLVRFEHEFGKTTSEYFQVGPPMIQDSSIKFRHYSPTFKWSVAGLMKATNGDGGKLKPFLQIWREEDYVCEVDLSKEHGEFSTDEFFGWIGWDESEDLFIYQAEKAEPKAGQQDYKYNPSFGEVLPTKKDPMIFVFDLKNRKVSNKLEQSEEYIPTQILYVQREQAVYFVGYETLPKKYGIMYCINRPCHLYRWSIKTAAAEQLTTDRQAPVIHYPVYDASNQQILFMGTHVGGSHYHAFSLYAFDLEHQHVSTILRDEDMNQEGINGLFPINNPQQQIYSNGHLFFSSYLRTQKVILSVCQSDKAVRIASRLDLEGEDESSWKLLQVHDQIILAAKSSRVSPPRLMVGLISERGQVDWFPAIKEQTSGILSGLEQHVYNVQKFVDIVLTKPKDKEASEIPLIVFPHGGPNYSYVSEYSIFSAIASLLGYAVAAINYTGSAGYGMVSIRALEGQIGTTDVGDCLTAIGYLVEKQGYNKDNMFLYGGSHGGFLVAHLSCRPEFTFRACAAINAVIDLPSMCITSDIPDFAFGQLGLPFDLRKPAPPGRGELEIMRLSSPSSRVHQARTPTIVLLGEQDLRVPPSQGMAWYTWLKARGIPAEAYLYPNTGHAIDSAEGEFQEFYQTFRFFSKYL